MASLLSARKIVFMSMSGHPGVNQATILYAATESRIISMRFYSVFRKQVETLWLTVGLMLLRDYERSPDFMSFHSSMCSYVQGVASLGIQVCYEMFAHDGMLTIEQCQWLKMAGSYDFPDVKAIWTAQNAVM
jgi:hypothetical protein